MPLRRNVFFFFFFFFKFNRLPTKNDAASLSVSRPSRQKNDAASLGVKNAASLGVLDLKTTRRR